MDASMCEIPRHLKTETERQTDRQTQREEEARAEKRRQGLQGKEKVAR